MAKEVEGRTPKDRDVTQPVEIFSSRQAERVEGFEYPPFSIVNNPALREVHELTRAYCHNMDGLSTARWLFNLPDHEAKPRSALGYAGRFTSVSDHSSSGPSLFTGQKAEDTQALLIYTTAKLEHELRLQGVRAPEGTDSGISKMIASELAKLSNIYRYQYEKSEDKPGHLIVLAHDLSQYAFRFKGPDPLGYMQTLGHWLHLSVDSHPKLMKPEKFNEYEEKLKLILALEELGSGPQNEYVPLVVRDLKTLYVLQSRDEEVQVLEDHFRDIPSVRGEPEIYHEQQFAARRAEEERLKGNRPHRRGRKHHRK